MGGAATLLAALVLSLPGSVTDRTTPWPPRAACKRPPHGQFSPGNTNPNSPAGVLWMNKWCKR